MTFRNNSDFMKATVIDKCHNCGKMTKWLELNYECYICSQTCLDEIDRRFADAYNGGEKVE